MHNNAYLYVFYGNFYIEKFSFYYNNQKYTELLNMVLEHQNLNKNNLNLKFKLSTKECLNLKYIHHSKFKQLAQIKTNNCANSLYIFAATIVCFKCEKKPAVLNKTRKCFFCLNKNEFDNDTLISLII
jgi:hypothetical protein